MKMEEKGIIRKLYDSLVYPACAAVLVLGCSPEPAISLNFSKIDLSKADVEFSTEYRGLKGYWLKGGKKGIDLIGCCRDTVTYWQNNNTRVVLIDDWAKISPDRRDTIDQVLQGVDKSVLKEDDMIECIEVYRYGHKTSYRPSIQDLKEATSLFIEVAKHHRK